MLDIKDGFNSEWPELRLIDIANYQNGHAFYKDGYSDHGLIAIDLFNVDEEGKLRFGARDKYVAPKLCEKYSRFKLNKGDLVIVMTDMTQTMGILGKSAIIDKDDKYILNQRIGRIVPDLNKVNTRYLHYFINSPLFLRPLHQLAKGAVQKYVNTEDIKEAVVSLPPLSIQHRIADILTKYDDLIENNLRRIEILEEMARRLYEEWFVHFRFPGHEEARFKESELGSIPEGWSLGTLQDVIVLQRGFDLPVKKRTPGHIPIISATGGNGTHNEAKVKGPGVITGRSGSIGKVIYTHGDYWPLNTTLWGKSFPLGSTLFAFYTLSSIDLKGFNVGAAVPTLNRNDIHNLPVAIPIKAVLSSFDQLVGPMHKLMDTLRKKNTILRAQRDLLLPKLVSGDIDVSNISMPGDKEVEAA